ncbi:MAG: hypothetical protein OQK56_01235 [Ignavibacteriaceae bacterium]|jgi:hypothetical protein|nr:hypothetical protein [Ignavibacteriaceae bacterium]MCW9064929.1 hypothetical protein [Ignavibacteriaceae bacterium]
MKTLSLALLIGGMFISSNFGQERTDEKKWTIDPQTGDTLFTSSVIVSQSEDITPRNSMIVINPLKFLVFYNISYFQKLNESTAIGVGLQMPTISGVNGFGVNAEARFYPKGNNLRGFYLAPNFSYNNLTEEGDNENVSITSAGGLVGWQWFPGEQFAMGLGIGVDYYFFSGNSDDFEDYNGFAPALRFDIGFAW